MWVVLGGGIGLVVVYLKCGGFGLVVFGLFGVGDFGCLVVGGVLVVCVE